MSSSPLTTGPPVVERLRPLIGVWHMEAVVPDDPPVVFQGRSVFEAMPGGNFVAQFWEGTPPYAPDGIAVIGLDSEADRYVRHSYDSRGIARVYAMSFSDGTWTLTRHASGVHQRFVGVFGNGGRTITGECEHSTDGETWELEFTLTYSKLR